jgi:hypothetical protein
MNLSKVLRQLRRFLRIDHRQLYRPCFVADAPDTVKPGIMYIVGEKSCYWAAAFRCPCGCGETLWLNLLPGHSQYWQFELDRAASISLWPSINRIVGCRSHFFVRRGRIEWFTGSTFDLH